MRLIRLLKVIVAVGVAGLAGLFLYGYARNHPQDMPWTPLDLTQPIGMFTGRKLAGLDGPATNCRDLLSLAGVQHTPVPPLSAGQCGYRDAVRLGPGGAREIGYRPADLATSCPVAAALALWEWHVVQPAALKHFGSRVETIRHFGSYSCRRINGREEGEWSEHATANAVDIAGFVLANNERIDVSGDWNRSGRKAAFLRDVRDGACEVFATVLSPDYNEAHADHLHFDQAARGQSGWRGCR